MTGTPPPRPGPHIGRSQQAAPQTPAREDDPRTKYRSTNGTGGTWFDAKEAPEFKHCPVAREITQIMDALEATDEDAHLEAKSQLKRFIRQAREGALTFDDPPAAGELPKYPDMLEIRVQVNPDHPDVSKRHLLRLYYAEPPEHEHVLLALHFARKPRGQDRDGVQTRQIKTAQWRYTSGNRDGATWGLSL